jgi:hypothetical protein
MYELPPIFTIDVSILSLSSERERMIPLEIKNYHICLDSNDIQVLPLYMYANENQSGDSSCQLFSEYT